MDVNISVKNQQPNKRPPLALSTKSKSDWWRSALGDERGSLSVLIIALFCITVAALMVMTDVATVMVAKRSLAQATEAAAQRAAHTLDPAAYYAGKGTIFTASLAAITGREHSPIPIDCNHALIDALLELRSWSNNDGDMKRHELQGIVLTNLECDGTSIEVSTYSEVKFPFRVPFSRMESAYLTSTAGTTNQVQEGFYLFGIRLN
ncbi:unannotated protein [freshwater metagenome]|uniref:Unannotated protein n=1 Tax=freshwater metagenome TaxID=449393 RepID=A0A6J6XJK2_9ZZZZ|nr:hypothetical protein [Actinomycetota bacterium]MSW62231.1 hypothetical protein [Actinomycetota bacterium]MSX89310.1 hypothetical protein [Actinomycetota bacterium]MSZ64117.1 hypothetical protein [Actinomycetota bacterium]MTA58438.1 hypothetical protein [Actinomycetota bacterium]